MYELELLIDGEKKKFIRNEPPMLIDLINALKIQQHQVTLLTNPDGASDEQWDKNMQDLGEFAVNFWHKQFKYQQVIHGLDLDNLKIVQGAIDDSLGEDDTDTDSEEKEEESKN